MKPVKKITIKCERKLKLETIIAKHATVHIFFQSLLHHFKLDNKPDQKQPELKCVQLILTVTGEPDDGKLLSKFYSLWREPWNKQVFHRPLHQGPESERNKSKPEAFMVKAGLLSEFPE
jgi:hypothetical protein